MGNVAAHHFTMAHMFSDGQLTGLLKASHHVGFLTFHPVTVKNRELVEHNAVLKQLGGLHVKSLVLVAIQSHPGVFLVDLPNHTVPLNLGLVR